MGMALSGLASGFDWKSIVDQLIEVSRAPQNRMRRDQATNSQKSSALDEIRGKLASLKTSVAALNSPDSLLKKSAAIADKTSNWTATATKDTPAGDYNVELMSQATTTTFKGRPDLGRRFIGSDLVLQSWLGSQITEGNFTVNGNQLSLGAGDKWENLVDNIENTAGVFVKWYARPLSSNGPLDDKFTLVTGSIAPSFSSGASSISVKSTAGFQVGDAISGTGIAPGTKILTIDTAAKTITLDKNTISDATNALITVDSPVRKVTIGSATDTSNVLQVLRLYNSSSNVNFVESDVETSPNGGTLKHGLGMIRLDTKINDGTSKLQFAQHSYQGGPSGGGVNASVAIDDGFVKQDSGHFLINNTQIPYNTNQDTIQDILDRITASAAGVRASYDRKLDQIILENKKPGNTAINVTSNFSDDKSQLAYALGLVASEYSTTGTVVSKPTPYGTIGTISQTTGQNATFRINGGGILQAQSSTLTETDHGIKGLTINANSLSPQSGGTYTPTKITVAGDTSAAKDALNDFVAKYNDVQNTIEKHTKVTVNGTKVTSSILSGNQELNILARSLRSSLFQSAGLTGTVNRLSDLGISSMGIQNTISLSNATALESKLSSAADDLANFFKTPTTGFVARFDKLLSSVVTESGSAAGSFKARQDSISKQNSSIDKQIEDMERRLASQRAMLESSFIAMERAQSGFQQQSAYLAKTFNGK
jgi:flagellar hook-associated protein 2